MDIKELNQIIKEEFSEATNLYGEEYTIDHLWFEMKEAIGGVDRLYFCDEAESIDMTDEELTPDGIRQLVQDWMVATY